MRNKNSNLYVETSTEMDKSIPSGEVAKSLANEQSKQPSSTLETSNIPGSHNQLQETDECDDSAAESEDVSTLLCFSNMYFIWSMFQCIYSSLSMYISWRDHYDSYDFHFMIIL